MKKPYVIVQFLAIALCICSLAADVKAQYSAGVSGTFALATDDLAKGAKNGFGGTIHLRYAFDDLIRGGLDIGYVTFANEHSESKVSPLIDGDNLSIIPVTAVFQVLFTDKKLKPYLGLEAGWAYANLNLITGSNNFVMVAPQFGMDYQISEQLTLGVVIKDNLLIYNRLRGGSDIISYIGFNGGIMYKF